MEHGRGDPAALLGAPPRGHGRIAPEVEMSGARGRPRGRAAAREPDSGAVVVAVAAAALARLGRELAGAGFGDAAEFVRDLADAADGFARGPHH
jgi:hypothetical protein